MFDPRFALYTGTSGLDRAREAQEDSTPPRPGGFAEASTSTSQVPSYEPGLSVVILNLDAPDLIVPLVTQLLEQREAFRRQGPRLEILIGDTGSSSPEVRSAYDEWENDVVVARGLSYHFSRCNNEMSRRAACSNLLFLNNDVILPPRPSLLFELFRRFQDMPDVGILGVILFFPDGTIQHCGIDFFREPPYRAFPFHPHAGEERAPEKLPDLFDSPAATGSFLLIRRKLFDELGGFPECYEIEAQDIDLCLRAHRLGHRVRIANLGNVIHLENATRPKGQEHWPDRRLFLRRWRSYVEANFL